MSAQWMDRLDFRAPDASGCAQVWASRRNCSISPRQLLGFFVSLSLLSLLVAGLCWVSGAKLVTPFTLLELLVMAGALLAYARHAADRERVEFGPEHVVVEWECAGRVERTELPTRQTRILVHDNGLIVFKAGQAQAFAGRYTRAERREKLARELRRALIAA